MKSCQVILTLSVTVQSYDSKIYIDQSGQSSQHVLLKFGRLLAKR